jgi:oligopeptide/dipeptide ABC transporter ATP-binding protein
MTALLTVEGLTTSLHTDAGIVRAVGDVSLHVAKGEAVALVGESGCGKSMTALSMMRLAPPVARIEAGRVLLDGRDLLRLSPREMRRVRGREMGMVFQDPMTFLNPLIRIGDQVLEAIRLHLPVRGQAAWDMAVEALDRVRIPDPARVMELYPHQLSGGMRQRVLIATAIACRPQLLICDEPTTALDVTIQAQIMDLLRSLRQELGSAILLITHDLGLVAEYCDRVYVMYAGRVVEEASVFDVFARPRHPYTRALLRSTLRLDRRAEGFHTIAGQPPNLVRPPPGCRFHPRCPEAFDRCRVDEPDLYGEPGARARCLLHEPAAA